MLEEEVPRSVIYYVLVYYYYDNRGPIQKEGSDRVAKKNGK